MSNDILKLLKQKEVELRFELHKITVAIEALEEDPDLAEALNLNKLTTQE